MSPGAISVTAMIADGLLTEHPTREVVNHDVTITGNEIADAPTSAIAATLPPS